MKNVFPIRTGDLNYKIDLNVPSTTGEWSVSLGLSGIKEGTWSISGSSGKIFDNRGYNIGSYLEKESYSISGVIFNTHHSIYKDRVLLSSSSPNVENDYNMVEITSNLNGYNPGISIEGESVINENFAQTHQYWGQSGDDRAFFVTENSEADIGFIETLEAIGFNVTTGNESGLSGGLGLDENYNLVVLGSATSSGNYNSGLWNSLNTNILSLNSHLISPENLNWERVSTTRTGVSTSVVANNDVSMWAEYPGEGWQELFYRSDFSSSGSYDYFMPYGATGTDTFDRGALIQNFFPDLRVWYNNGSDLSVNSIDAVSDPTYGLDSDINIDWTWTQSGSEAFDTWVSMTFGGTGEQHYTGDFPGDIYLIQDLINEYGKIIPQRRSYPVNFIYDGLDINSGDSFEMYNQQHSMSNGIGGELLISSSGYTAPLKVWHKGMWTGDAFPTGRFTENNLVCMSVTSTGSEWQTGYDMWNTLTVTGKRIFYNTAIGFFNQE